MSRQPTCEHGPRGYRPTPEQILQYNRRDFLKLGALAAGGAFGTLSLPGLGIVPEAWGAPPANRVVRVHCGSMQDWNFSDEDFGAYVKPSVYADMFARGITSLTQQQNVINAWQNLLVGYQPGHKIAIKLNLNSYDYNANQTCEMAYAIIESLKLFGVSAANMKVFDVVRKFPDYWRARWDSDVDYVNSTDVAWDSNATVYFPAIDTTHRFPTVLSQANHVIAVGLQKGHKSYVTGSMKNHFGSQELPADLHIERYDNICQLAASPFVRGKLRLIVVEGAFMTWDHEGHPFEETEATALFPVGLSGHSSPNYMMFGTNMVTIDSVLGAIQNYERAARGEDQWPNEFITMAAAAPYNLGTRENPTFVSNTAGWSQVDMHFSSYEYISYDLPLADRKQIDALNLKLRSGQIHWSQLQHLVERYNERL